MVTDASTLYVGVVSRCVPHIEAAVGDGLVKICKNSSSQALEHPQAPNWLVKQSKEKFNFMFFQISWCESSLFPTPNKEKYYILKSNRSCPSFVVSYHIIKFTRESGSSILKVALIILRFYFHANLLFKRTLNVFSSHNRPKLGQILSYLPFCNHFGFIKLL